MRHLPSLSPLAGIAATLLTGCGQPKQLYIDHAWVRLAALPSRPAAAYFTIHGGPTDATLVAVTTDVAIKSEMHASMATGGAHAMTTMTPVTSVAVPAGQRITFQPGGRHVMLFDVNPGIKAGATIALTLTFADSTRILQDANVVAAGDPAPQ